MARLEGVAKKPSEVKKAGFSKMTGEAKRARVFKGAILARLGKIS